VTCNILVKPLINLFHGERGANKWRTVLTQSAALKSNKKQVKKVIMETMQYFKELNP